MPLVETGLKSEGNRKGIRSGSDRCCWNPRWQHNLPKHAPWWCQAHLAAERRAPPLMLLRYRVTLLEGPRSADVWGDGAEADRRACTNHSPCVQRLRSACGARGPCKGGAAREAGATSLSLDGSQNKLSAESSQNHITIL